MTFKLIIKDIQNPTSYNALSLKKMLKQKQVPENLPSSTMALLNPSANIVGKWLGIDATHEWNQYYDKVWDLYQWAKVTTNSNDPEKLIGFLKEKAEKTNNMNSRKIVDLHIYYQLDSLKETPVGKVEEPTTEKFVKDWVEEQMKKAKAEPQLLSKLSAAKEPDTTQPIEDTKSDVEGVSSNG